MRGLIREHRLLEVLLAEKGGGGSVRGQLVADQLPLLVEVVVCRVVRGGTAATVALFLLVVGLDFHALVGGGDLLLLRLLESTALGLRRRGINLFGLTLGFLLGIFKSYPLLLLLLGEDLAFSLGGRFVLRGA